MWDSHISGEVSIFCNLLLGKMPFISCSWCILVFFLPLGKQLYISICCWLDHLRVFFWDELVALLKILFWQAVGIMNNSSLLGVATCWSNDVAILDRIYKFNLYCLMSTNARINSLFLLIFFNFIHESQYDRQWQVLVIGLMTLVCHHARHKFNLTYIKYI